MRGISRLLVFVLCFIFAAGAVSADTVTKLDRRIQDARYVFEDMQEMPDTGIPKGLIEKCAGIAIFPSMIKGAFIWGGKYGQGVMIARTDDGEWSAPMFLSIGGASWGLQIGGQSSDVILVIANKRGVESFAHSNVTLGGDASVAAGPVGRNAQVETDILLKAGVLSYSRSAGLFAGVSLEGSVVGPMKNLNEDYYGSGVTADQILSGKIEPSKQGAKLIKAVSDY